MAVLNARHVVAPLVGTTILTPSRGAPNEVLGLRDDDVLVRTQDSGDGGAAVDLAKIQQALDALFEHGAVAITPGSFDGYRRSSFIGAVLLTLDAVELDETISPPVVCLSPRSPLRDQLAKACSLAPQPRAGSGRVVADDELYQHMVHVLQATVTTIVAEPAYRVRASVGQPSFTWATTPWIAVFDRLVTESAQRGHYVVYLIDRDGSGGYLSLMQGVSELTGAHREQRLLARAREIRSQLPAADLDGLDLEPLELSGGGWRTNSYNAGTIAAVRLDAAALPHDAALIFELRRMLRLGDKVTDNDQATATHDDLPDDARTGSEARRYRWHLRAEGRNRTLAKRAKRLHGGTCAVCRRNFAAELGDLAQHCLDAHHLVPFAEMNERPTKLDPATDFAVVCANCHRLLHSQTPPLTPQQLQEILAQTTH